MTILWRNGIVNVENTNKASDDYKNNIKNLVGTFAVEGMSISNESMLNLEKLATGKKTCSEIVQELKMKYMQRI